MWEWIVIVCFYALILSRANTGRRLAVVLRAGREILDVRVQRVQTALSR